MQYLVVTFTCFYFSDDSKISETDTASKKIYDLTSSVQVWSDFLRPHLHPNAIYLFDNLMPHIGRATAESSGDTLGGFSSGHSVFQREEVEEEITDRIRCLAEACNSLQASLLHHLKGSFGVVFILKLGYLYLQVQFITFLLFITSIKIPICFRCT